MKANFDKNIEKIINTGSHKVKITKKAIPSYNSVQQDLPTDKGASRSYVIGGISFGAMKKPQFSGFDLLVVNKFKAPIEKFKSTDDFQEWCGSRIDEILDINYPPTRHRRQLRHRYLRFSLLHRS